MKKITCAICGKKQKPRHLLDSMMAERGGVFVFTCQKCVDSLGVLGVALKAGEIVQNRKNFSKN